MRVSVDVQEMAPGEPFPERIRKLIGEAHATIALIGKQWMPRSDGIHEERKGDDWVQTELELSASALIDQLETDRYGRTQRLVIPLFADCERMFDHHPEWRNVFNQVTVSLTTWDARRRVTIYDLNLALYMNMAAKVVAKRQAARRESR